MKMPSVPGFHPRNATLNRYADRALELGSAKRVRVHLIGCLRCREAAFAIEDDSATRLDAHRGKRWELFAYGANGRPRYDALLSATRERAGWDARHDAARMLVAEYPDGGGRVGSIRLHRARRALRVRLDGHRPGTRSARPARCKRAPDCTGVTGGDGKIGTYACWTRSPVSFQYWNEGALGACVSSTDTNDNGTPQMRCAVALWRA